jgi:hypothetical protein
MPSRGCAPSWRRPSPRRSRAWRPRRRRATSQTQAVLRGCSAVIFAEDVLELNEDGLHLLELFFGC